jgi:hypothetical protein
VNLVRLHVFVVEKTNDDSLVIFHQWSRNWKIYRFQKIIYPFSFDQRNWIRYDLQNIEVGSEYLSSAMPQAPTPLTSGWRHYLWITLYRNISKYLSCLTESSHREISRLKGHELITFRIVLSMYWSLISIDLESCNIHSRKIWIKVSCGFHLKISSTASRNLSRLTNDYPVSDLLILPKRKNQMV